MKGIDLLLTVKAPGKLYIAGEDAVVEPGQPAILIAVDQFVYATVEKSTQGCFSSKQLTNKKLFWAHQAEQLIPAKQDHDFDYVVTAAKITEHYAHEQGKELTTYTLKLDSDLDSPEGKKYGLGSSAAVTVAVVKALNAFYDLKLDSLEIFKLAAIAHYTVQKNGSLGDIAASSFGGWIAYHSCDRNWLMEQVKTHSISELLALPWPKLKIESLTPPSDLRLLIGWTGSPASTSKLVNEVSLSKDERKQRYSDFLAGSKACLTKMIIAFKEHDLVAIQKQIKRDRQLLKTLEQITQVVIETDTLRALIELSFEFGAQAKTSGAGGGDCGIAILDQALPYKELLLAWQEHGITPLDICVYNPQKGG